MFYTSSVRCPPLVFPASNEEFVSGDFVTIARDDEKEQVRIQQLKPNSLICGIVAESLCVGCEDSRLTVYTEGDYYTEKFSRCVKSYNVMDPLYLDRYGQLTNSFNDACSGCVGVALEYNVTMVNPLKFRFYPGKKFYGLRIKKEESWKRSTTHCVSIYLAGPIEVAKQILREECKKQGLCVTIEPCDYIYTGGEETGYRVGLLNYPRFPAKHEDIEDRAITIANLLRERTYQSSCLVVTPEETLWFSDKE